MRGVFGHGRRLKNDRRLDPVRLELRPLFSHVPQLLSPSNSVEIPNFLSLVGFVIREEIHRTHAFTCTAIDANRSRVLFQVMDHYLASNL